MKSKRQDRILEIIGMRNVETQEELIELLHDDGFRVTQATVSRDIKELGLVKVSTKDNSYKYALPAAPEHDSIKISAKYRNIMRETVLKVDSASNIVVVKTYSGMANAAAAAIDGMGWGEIVGSIAGDDTIMVVVRTAEHASEFVKRLNDTLING